MNPGDRVYVDDPGLAMLRDVVRRHGGEPPPNHYGTVESVLPAEEGAREEAMVVIVFDGEGEATSNSAPYPSSEVHPLDPSDDPYRQGTA